MPSFILCFIYNALYFALRGDGRVVGAGKPQRSLSFHAVETRQSVFNREHRRVAHMESSRYVRRREHHCKYGGVGGRDAIFNAYIGIKKTAFLPFFVNATLGFFRVVRF